MVRLWLCSEHTICFIQSLQREPTFKTQILLMKYALNWIRNWILQKYRYYYCSKSNTKSESTLRTDCYVNASKHMTEAVIYMYFSYQLCSTYLTYLTNSQSRSMCQKKKSFYNTFVIWKIAKNICNQRNRILDKNWYKPAIDGYI